MKLRVFPILALVALPQLALAADPPKNDPAAAQVLFYEARTLMQQNRFAEACPKLEESLRLDAGLGTQFNLADCNEHIGKIASAWAGFLEVAASAKATNQIDREKVARKRAQALESRLPKLVVDAPSAPPGLDVKRDGIAVGSAAWGTPIPVDPGSHKITATAPGKGTWESSVSASEGKVAHIAIPRDLPPAPIAAAPPAPVGVQPVAPATAMPASGGTATATTATTGATDFPPPVVEENGSVQRTIGWVVTGVGVVGVGIGAGFGLSSLGKRNESRSHCVVDACDGVGVGLRDDAIRNGNIATVATIAGGAAVAGGILLILTAPSSSESHERAGKLHAVPSVGLNGGGLSLQGSFL
jgi:serine/threonine-protein kinase